MAAAAPTAHVARVRALYRQGLRTILNWAVDREVFYSEVRDTFVALTGNQVHSPRWRQRLLLLLLLRRRQP